MAKLLQNLHKHQVSRTTGFVPEIASARLPRHYDAWEDTVAELPTHLKAGTFQEVINKLPLISVSELDYEQDWQRAYVLLAFLIHGLVHGCKQDKVPASLSEPFFQTCNHLGMEPVLSYTGLCLYNWHQDPQRKSLTGLKSIATFTGTIDEEAFYLVPVIIERLAGNLPAALLQAQSAAEKGYWPTVGAYLDTCTSTFRTMTDALSDLSLCKPGTFYLDIRPYIAGLDVSYERLAAPPHPVKVAGGSAAQSPLFQFLDHILGIKHRSTMPKDMRGYMTRAHREFLEEVDQLPSIAELADNHMAGGTIATQLEECRKTLKSWRDKHIAIVTRYIMLPAQAAARKDGGATAVMGTAGSSPVAFLKEMRNDTVLKVAH